MSDQNIIDKAIEVLHRDGWSKGAFTNSDGSHCILGACYAVGELNQYGIAALYDQASADGLGVMLTSFNDDPSTSYEDVLLFMKKASARLDEAQGT